MAYTRNDIVGEIKSFRNRMNAKVAVIDKNNNNVLDYAVYNAYRDMQPRTIKGHNIAATQTLREKMAEKFLDYFEGSAPKERADFDKFHKATCGYFLRELNKIVPDPQEFGKAQKFVNMTFKYLYCFDNAEKYEDHFKFCHMPIDSYTLNWYFDNQKQLQKQKKITKSAIKNWSSLTEGQYGSLKDNIREMLPGETPLLVEFRIWPQEIAKVEEKELAKAILEYLYNNYESYISNSNSFTKLSKNKDEECIKQTVKRKIKDLENDRQCDGYEDGLDIETLAEMLGQLSNSNLLVTINEAIKKNKRETV